MNIEFLGTGGAIAAPRPLCGCRVCVEAREKGVPYSRSGPSLFVHGPDVLIDTPEEIRDQINRSRIERIAACLYSHWHPDHVMGRRVFEMNVNWRAWPPQNRRTDIYLPGRVGKDLRRMLGTWEHLKFLEKVYGAVRLIELEEGESLTLGGVRITPFPLAEENVYAFMFEEDGKCALIAPDELKGWEPPEWVRGVDLAVLPKGLDEFDPLTGERRIPEGHPILRIEATFEETLEILNRLEAKRTILTHIEELDGLSYDDLQTLERNLRREGVKVTFAYDTLMVDV